MIQWIGTVSEPGTEAAEPTPVTSGPFQTGPAWDEQTTVPLFAGGVPALVPAGRAVSIWRREVDHAAVRLTAERCPQH